MARIIRDRQVVEDDRVRVADGEPLPASGRVIVSHERWAAEKETLRARGGVGLAIPPTLDVAELADDLPHLEAIVVAFVFIQPRPEGGRTFDGRGYTQARLLRERYGYTGELRAAGDVFRDVMHYMGRCGINAFEPRPGLDPAEALAAFGDFSIGYQAAADGVAPVFRRRRPG